MPATVRQAATALGITERQLRRELGRGAPQLRRGRRGRGGAALLDIGALRAWRAERSGENALRVLAAEIPELVAAAVHRVFCDIQGPHKRASAGVLAGAWLEVATALRERIAADVPDLPEIDALPELISRLRQI